MWVARPETRVAWEDEVTKQSKGERRAAALSRPNMTSHREWKGRVEVPTVITVRFLPQLVSE